MKAGGGGGGVQQLVKWLDLEDKTIEINLFALHYLPLPLCPPQRVHVTQDYQRVKQTTHYWLFVLLYVHEDFHSYKNWDAALKRLIVPEHEMIKDTCRCTLSLSLLLLGQNSISHQPETHCSSPRSQNTLPLLPQLYPVMLFIIYFICCLLSSA